MIVHFEKSYLKELYECGQSNDKAHRYQPQIVKKYTKVINLMKSEVNTQELIKYKSLHYEHLQGNKKGISSVRVNDQYRVEFIEEFEGEEQIANICNIIELSNHYK